MHSITNNNCSPCVRKFCTTLALVGVAALITGIVLHILGTLPSNASYAMIGVGSGCVGMSAMMELIARCTKPKSDKLTEPTTEPSKGPFQIDKHIGKQPGSFFVNSLNDPTVGSEPLNEHEEILYVRLYSSSEVVASEAVVSCRIIQDCLIDSSNDTPKMIWKFVNNEQNKTLFDGDVQRFITNTYCSYRDMANDILTYFQTY